MPNKRKFQIAFSPDAPPFTIEGDLELEITDGLLVVRDYTQRPDGTTQGVVYAAVPGAWLSCVLLPEKTK